jgi:transcriptional regulator with XRE-family HTH domain
MSIQGDRLRDIRIQRDLSQRELAKRCGLGEKAIFRYENNIGNPGADYLARIARELSVSADYLLGLSDNPRGQLGDNELNNDEQKLLEVFRRGGWTGVSQLITDKLARILGQADKIDGNPGD